MSTATMTLKTVPRLLGFTTLLLASMFLLSSCQAEIKSVEPTLNPNPKEIYEITVTVENAPGEFKDLNGSVSFNRESWECLPSPSALSMSGAPPVAVSRSEKVNFRRISLNAFVAKVTLDPYIPMDDYGLGVCPWTAGSVFVSLYNGINHHDTHISPLKEISTKRATRIEFFSLKRSGQDAKISIANLPVDESLVYPENEFFFITITAKKVSP